MESFDLVIIGGGPAGYVAAIEGSNLGMSTAIIDKDVQPGGTCLNYGCIPSKTLLNIAKKFQDAQSIHDIGINIASCSIDINQVLFKKQSIVNKLGSGITSLFYKNKISYFKGVATIQSRNSVYIKFDDKEDIVIRATNIIIATGSKVKYLNNIDVDNKNIVSSNGALEFNVIPEKLAIIGGGYIGVEMAAIWSMFGSHVTIIEESCSILNGLDREISSYLYQYFIRSKIEIITQAKVQSARSVDNDIVDITILDKENNLINIQANKLLISVGRNACTNNLGLEDIGINVDKNGFIVVNSNYQTCIDNIYAVGDVIGGIMLAHKAEEEAKSAVNFIANKVRLVNYNLIPSVVYIKPEIASIGYTEDEVIQQNIPYKTGKFPFLANSMAHVSFNTDGFVKIISHKFTDRILGCHIIGSNANSLICEIAAYMEFGATSYDVGLTCHPHPTLNEALKEASLNVNNKSINI